MKKGIGGMPATTIKSLGGSAWGGKVKKRVIFVKSFSLAEVLLGTIILILVISATLITYINCFILIDTIKNINIATTAAQSLMEEIRSFGGPCDPGNTLLDQIAIDYNNSNFVINDIPESMGVVYVDNTNSEFLEITVSVCWRQRNRVIGEDTNLNGSLDAGEDLNNNGIIDSAAQLTTRMVNRK